MKKSVILFFCVIFISLVAHADESKSNTSNLFQTAMTRVSISFTAKYTDLDDPKENQVADYWGIRSSSGVSLRIDYHLDNPMTFMFYLYPAVDPFMVRVALFPQKYGGFKNEVFRKQYKLNPKVIDLWGVWHSFMDDLSQLEKREPLKLEGNETLNGFECEKILAGDPSKDSIRFWYSPKLDLVLKSDYMTQGKVSSTKELSNIKLGDVDPSKFKVPPEFIIDDLSSQAFDSLDFQKLGTKH